MLLLFSVPYIALKVSSWQKLEKDMNNKVRMRQQSVSTLSCISEKMLLAAVNQ
jgi:hypothetical protein